MTAKEKAQELVNKYINLFYHPTEQYLDTGEAKKCALIAIDEILSLDFNIKCDATERCVMSIIDYYQKVKQEI